MALISVKTILTSICLFHILLAFFFFADPESVAGTGIVYVLGQAMGMPQSNNLTAGSPSLSFLSVALLLLGITDLITLSLPEEIWLIHHWGAQAPLRVLFFLCLSLFTFVTAPSAKPSGSHRLAHPVALQQLDGKTEAGGWDGLRNRVFFAFAFVEMLSWFWVWVTLREEARVFVGRKRRRGSSSGGASGSAF